MFTHFINLLGKPNALEDLDEEIPDILKDLEINDTKFSLEEYKKVKTALKGPIKVRQLQRNLTNLYHSKDIQPHDPQPHQK